MRLEPGQQCSCNVDCSHSSSMPYGRLCQTPLTSQGRSGLWPACHWLPCKHCPESREVQSRFRGMSHLVSWLEWKKRSETDRRKHCARAVVRPSQKFRPAADPFPGAQDGQNLISWRWSLPSHTGPVWWRSMHAISSYHGNRPTHTKTHRQDRLQYTAPLRLARRVTR